MIFNEFNKKTFYYIMLNVHYLLSVAKVRIEISCAAVVCTVIGLESLLYLKVPLPHPL